MLSNKITIVFALILLVLVGFVTYDYLVLQKKIGYIDLETVFDGFEMKKELASKYEAELKRLRRQQDSLSNVVQHMKDSKSLLELEKSDEFKRAAYYLQLVIDDKHQLEDEDLKMIDNQIQERLSGYLKEFALENGIDMLVSSSQGYPVIYANQAMDYSQQAIEYINNAYNDK